MKVKIKKSSVLQTASLYELEEIMGKCCGHGMGFGGEDIDWHIGEKENKWWEVLTVSSNDRCPRKLEISYYRYYESFDNEELPLNTLPKRWQNRLLKLLKTHTRKRTLV